MHSEPTDGRTDPLYATSDNPIQWLMPVLTNLGICMVCGVAAHAMAERALRTRGIGLFNYRVWHFRRVARAHRIPKSLTKGDSMFSAYFVTFHLAI